MNQRTQKIFEALRSAEKFPEREENVQPSCSWFADSNVNLKSIIQEAEIIFSNENGEY